MNGTKTPYLALPPEIAQHMLTLIRDAVAGNSSPAGIITEDERVRPFLRNLLALQFPYLPVLARAELVPGYQERLAGLIPWREPDRGLSLSLSL